MSSRTKQENTQPTGNAPRRRRPIVVQLALIAWICIAAPAKYGFAQSCGELDWAVVGWPNGTLNNTYNTPLGAIAFAITDDANAILQRPGFPVDLPLISQTYQGIDTLTISVNFGTFGTSNELVIDLSLGEPGIGLDNVEFRILDADGESGGFARDESYVVTGALGGSMVSPNLSGSAAQVISGNQIRGVTPTPQTGAGATDGDAIIEFPSPVDQIRIVFSIVNSPVVNPASTPGFGVSNFNFCQAPSPPVAVPALPSNGRYLLIALMGFLASFHAARERLTESLQVSAHMPIRTASQSNDSR